MVAEHESVTNLRTRLDKLTGLKRSSLFRSKESGQVAEVIRMEDAPGMPTEYMVRVGHESWGYSYLYTLTPERGLRTVLINPKVLPPGVDSGPGHIFVWVDDNHGEAYQQANTFLDLLEGQFEPVD